MSFPLVSETHRVIYTTVKAQTPNFLPLFLVHIPVLTSPTSSVFDMERCTFFFASVTYTPLSVSRNDQRKWTFLCSLQLYTYRIEMKCNIYCVCYYSMCKISTATTIVTSCFIITTTFSPLTSPRISLHPIVTSSSPPCVVVSFPPPSTPEPVLLQIIYSHPSPHSSPSLFHQLNILSLSCSVLLVLLYYIWRSRTEMRLHRK